MEHMAEPQERSGTRHPPLPPTRILLFELQELIERQQALLQHLTYLSEHEDEVDNRRNAAWTRLSLRYPELDQERLVEFVDGVINIHEDPESRGILAQRTNELLGVQSGYDVEIFLWDAFHAVSRVRLMPRVYANQLTALIADFEEFCGTLLRIVAVAKADHTIRPDRKFEWQQLSAYGSIEDFRAQIIEDEVSGWMRGGLGKWLEALGRFGVRLPKAARSGEIVEAFERRHVVVHNGGRVSRPYVQALKNDQIAGNRRPGEFLETDPDYLYRVADKLCELAYGVTANTVSVLATDDDEAGKLESLLVNTVYDLLVENRASACEAICREFEAAPFRNDSSSHILAVNKWLAMRSLGRDREARDEARSWDTSALHPRFQMARLVIMGEHSDALDIIEPYIGTPGLEEHLWKTWPLTAPLRALQAERDSSDRPSEDHDLD